MENNEVKSPMVGDDRTQLAIHKHGQGFELRTTENNSS